MITITASQTAAIQNPLVEPRTLVTMATSRGPVRVAMEPMQYGGFYYDGRMTTPPAIQIDVGGGTFALPTGRTVTVELANADGYFNAFRPEDYRNRTMQIDEVVRAVDSMALRTFLFTMTGATSDREKCRIEAVDQWGDVGRRLVPNVTLNTSMYPELPPENVGAPGTLLFGRALVPLVLVDEVTDAENRFFATIGSADWGSNSATVVEAFAGTMFVVESFRLVRREVAGMPVTEVLIASPIRASGTGPVTQHYADLVSYHGSEAVFPNVLLIDLVKGRFAGNALTTGIDSAGLQAAQSFYATASLGFSCVLTTQRQLDDLLGHWSHDALTHLALRDKMYLIPQASRAPVASIHVGNILRGQWTITDIPLGQEESIQITTYMDRTRALPAGEFYGAGSGATGISDSPFIGTPSVAQRVSQYWAKRAAGGIRGYGWDSTVRLVTLEPGDLVTLTHSLMAADGRIVEIIRQSGAANGPLHFDASELPYTVFSVGGVPSDPPFRRLAQKFYLTNALSYALNPTLGSAGFASSHAIYGTPTLAQVVWANQQWARHVSTSLVVANDSVFTVQFFTQTGSVPNLQTAVQYVALRTV